MERTQKVGIGSLLWAFCIWILPASAQSPSPAFKYEIPRLDGSQSNTFRQPILKVPAAYTRLGEYGIELNDQGVGAQKYFSVKSVILGSRAASWGISRGDKIVSFVETNGPPTLTISRDGKLYSVDLSHERESLSFTANGLHAQQGELPSTTANGLSAQPPQMNPQPGLPHELAQMAGHYVGNLAGDKQITIEIKISPEGVPSGYFTRQWSGGSYSGSLSDGFVNENQLSFMWHDNAGYGKVTITFASDKDSFKGYWFGSRENSFMELTGRRQ